MIRRDKFAWISGISLMTKFSELDELQRGPLESKKRVTVTKFESDRFICILIWKIWKIFGLNLLESSISV